MGETVGTCYIPPASQGKTAQRRDNKVPNCQQVQNVHTYNRYECSTVRWCGVHGVQYQQCRTVTKDEITMNVVKHLTMGPVDIIATGHGPPLMARLSTTTMNVDSVVEALLGCM